MHIISDFESIFRVFGITDILISIIGHQHPGSNDNDNNNNNNINKRVCTGCRAIGDGWKIKYIETCRTGS